MTARELQPVVREPGAGTALWHLGALMNFKARMEDTGGRCWMLEGLADHTMAVPLHAHAHEDELWYVLDGEIAFTAGSATQTLATGGTVFIPRGTPHTFRIVSATARWFGVGIDGRLDDWFFETGVPAESLTLPPPPPGPPTPEQIRAITESLERYGTETLGPPPG